MLDDSTTLPIRTVVVAALVIGTIILIGTAMLDLGAVFLEVIAEVGSAN